MADDQKYYYMRLKEGFFDSDEIKLIEAMPDGYLYCNILLKLYLKSLKFDGKLMFSERIPYNPSALATITGHPVGIVEKALKVFDDMELIEILSSGAIYMLDIQSLIGKSSTEADRKRDYRNRIETEKKMLLESGQTSGQSSGQMSGQKSGQNSPEIEIEIDIEKENNIVESEESKTSEPDPQSPVPVSDSDDEQSFNNACREIVDYLNQKAHTQFRYNTKQTKDHIRARFRDHYTVDDFKRVIDNQCREWMNTKMQKYLRPNTLFAGKFESYLNAPTGRIDNDGEYQRSDDHITGKIGQWI